MLARRRRRKKERKMKTSSLFPLQGCQAHFCQSFSVPWTPHNARNHSPTPQVQGTEKIIQKGPMQCHLATLLILAAPKTCRKFNSGVKERRKCLAKQHQQWGRGKGEKEEETGYAHFLILHGHAHTRTRRSCFGSWDYSQIKMNQIVDDICWRSLACWIKDFVTRRDNFC